MTRLDLIIQDSNGFLCKVLLEWIVAKEKGFLGAG